MPITLKREPRLEAKHLAFKYQQDAVDSVRDRVYAAIFHEQGLGKSKIAIDLLLYWLETKVVDTVLLVAKKSLITNWLREFSAHSYLKPLVLTTDRRRNYYVFNSPARLVLTHYEAIRAERSRIELYLKTRSVGIILDESTKIKNPESDLTKTFLDLGPSFARRVIMTGTPVANRPYDLWSQIRFLDGGAALGNDFAAFRESLNLTNDLAEDHEAQLAFENSLADLRTKLEPFSIRDTKSSGVIQLPAKEIRTIVTDWEPRQADLYSQIRQSMAAVITCDGELTEDKADDVLKRLLRLVQIASNPALVDEAYSLDPGKYEPLHYLIAEIVAASEKCIVWTSFTENADWLAGRLKPYGAERVHGKMSMDQRNRSIDLFIRDSECRVLIATPGAAKEGLTLTVANHVIFFDRSFSLDDYLQAQDRIHRVSQQKTCYVYNLIMRDSIDEWVELLLHAKRLAAQLAQGDISIEYYRSQMSYSYGEVIRGILALEGATSDG